MTYSVPPFCFRTTIQPEEIISNRNIVIDLMYINEKQVLHIASTAKTYLIKASDVVRVYPSYKWEGQFTVKRTKLIIISVTDGKTVKNFNITALYP